MTKYTGLVNAGSTNGGKNVNLAAIGGDTVILHGDTSGAFSIGPAYSIYGTALPEAAANGITNLLFFTPNGFSLLASNGDGTFQGQPNLPIGPHMAPPNYSAAPNGLVTADINGDGFTDILALTATTQNNLITAIGRGDGTFVVTHQLRWISAHFSSPAISPQTENRRRISTVRRITKWSACIDLRLCW